MKTSAVHTTCNCRYWKYGLAPPEKTAKEKGPAPAPERSVCVHCGKKVRDMEKHILSEHLEKMLEE
jgi:hypothetical protein